MSSAAIRFAVRRAPPQVRAGRWLFTGGVRYEWFLGRIGSEGFDPTLEDVATPGDIPEFYLALFNAGVVYDLTPALQLYDGFSQGAEIIEALLHRSAMYPAWFQAPPQPEQSAQRDGVPLPCSIVLE